MAPSRILALAFLFSLVCSAANGQLSPNFYSKTCPRFQDIVRNAMTKAVAQNGRTAASILRMFFHDCFVQRSRSGSDAIQKGLGLGCDASILLDGGEKNAAPNLSLQRFELIDSIKTSVEAACKGVVSCADILATATLEGVAAVGGPRWTLNLGRRDAKSAASVAAVVDQLPPFSVDLPKLISAYGAKGLDTTDMTALSGGHTIGQAQCSSFRDRIYKDTNIDPTFAATRRANCPLTTGNSTLAPLDLFSPVRFDNSYFKNLVARKGLLHSDQELFNGGSQDALVRSYSTNQAAFFADFAKAMVKMGDITPLTGSNGEIRKNCRVPN